MITTNATIAVTLSLGTFRISQVTVLRTLVLVAEGVKTNLGPRAPRPTTLDPDPAFLVRC